MSPCNVCARECGADRALRAGFCRAPEGAVVAKVMVHRWEEPPVSGSRGSGAVFFSGCNMRCVYCQNAAISRQCEGQAYDAQGLSKVFLELQEQGVHNINLVSPMHFVPAVRDSLVLSKRDGLSIPVVYNTNSYELPQTLRTLEGLVDVWLPDLKYMAEEPAVRYSQAPGYPEIAKAAILEMRRQQPHDVYDGEGMLQKGMIIRHLILPGLRMEAFRMLDWVRDSLPGTLVSVMSQYLPHDGVPKELGRRVTTFECESVLSHFREIGLDRGFCQGREAADERYVPDF